MSKLHRISFIGCLLILAWLKMATAQEYHDLLLPTLEFRPNGELTILKAFCKNNTTAPLLLNYELHVQQDGPSGKIENQHRGEFDLTPRKQILLVNATLNITPADNLNVILKIFSDRDLVAIDSLHQKSVTPTPSPELLELAETLIKQSRKNSPNPELKTPTAKTNPLIKQRPNPKNSTAKQLKPTTNQLFPNNPIANTKVPTASAQALEARPQVSDASQPQGQTQASDITHSSPSPENFGIDGLVLDETRTKMAHDFYDLFYRKWTAPATAKDFIIYIKELPARGRLARVALVVNDDQVVQRALSPRADLLEQQVNIAIRALVRHLNNKENVKNQLGSEDTMGSGIF